MFDFVVIGDHIRIRKMVYHHHMLVIRVIDPYRKIVRVIHYSDPEEDSTEKAMAKISGQILEEEEVIWKPITLAVYKDHVDVFKPREAIRRARSRRGETEYELLSNNCESFVNWALTDEDVTDQGKAVKTGASAAVGIGLGVGIVGAAILGVAAYLKMSGRSDDSDENENN